MRTFIVLLLIFLALFIASLAGMFIVGLAAGGSVSQAFRMAASVGFDGSFTIISPLQGILFCVFAAISVVSVVGLPCALAAAFLKCLWRSLFSRRATSGPEAKIDTPVPNRRWQFSMASLLWVTLLVSVVLSLFAVGRESFRRQREGLVRLEAFGPRVGWNLWYVSNLSFTSADRIDDSAIPLLSPFSRLQSLSLSNSGITDEGLKQLAELRLESLKTLFLYGTNASDDGLRGLLENPTLETLYLGDTRITDETLKRIAAMANLQSLQLAETDISDSGLEHLHGLKNLRYLDIQGTNVSPSAVTRLRKTLPPGTILYAPPAHQGEASQQPSVETGVPADSLEQETR